MTEFYSAEITGKSYAKLIELRRELDFVLIGGWAIYLHTKALKSKDIDIVVDYPTLFELKQKYGLSKNDFLKKYEIKLEYFDIDIYVPAFSKLAVSPKDILANYTLIEGIKVVEPEILLLLKQGAYSERKHSTKGKKDALDIALILLHTELDFKKYDKWAKDATSQRRQLKEILSALKDQDVRYLNMSRQEFVKKRKEIIAKLQR